ncbi:MULTISPECIES: dihydropyrimidinase [Rhizobium]|uniref:Dihydropyrimidinase n=1 Tax=Rhizobium rhododendri TaxID=2506430 RepID=A0ABY8ISL9_9HYPH|nr:MULTISPECIES: dihydropyrimidinase [Rhizobium]TQX85200.1 dihydropyrimidinase [Rhizobium sp. rho-13.1]TQY09488.1 dihydropyrimidinase [Rhizobium sp. rho-1.1]WFS25970.1 dihydropyrimidinase [Rhizobium rhododendri]
MQEFDLVVRGGTIVTASDTFKGDIGINDGRIAALGLRLDGRDVIEAEGKLVMPGGVDSHCHIEQLEADGSVHEETFLTAGISAFAGGTTTVIPFAPQFKGEPIAAHFGDYQARAARSPIDYAFHQIITDPTDSVIGTEIPALIEAGIRSLKVFLTYDPLHIDDRQFLRVLEAARQWGATVCVHCENYDAIRWRSEKLLAEGRSEPASHALSRPKVVEREATYRAIALAELVGQPIHIFHVSCAEVAEEIARAQRRGVKVTAETCPQYLVLTAADMSRPDREGAKFMCSPSPRDAGDAEGLWAAIRAGTLDVISSDHCGYSFAGTQGKWMNGPDADFTRIPNGVPGLAARMAIVFSEGVVKGRIDLNDFVRLTATSPAKRFGLYPRKGTIAPGADADLVIWDAEKRVTLNNGLMQHAIDYTPYEGLEVVGWPIGTIARGRLVMSEGKVSVTQGAGKFLLAGVA